MYSVFMSCKNTTNNRRKGDAQMLKFKGYCAEHGIKQSEIAELLGITISNVNEKMNGKQPFTLEQVRILCEHYKISADEYFI